MVFAEHMKLTDLLSHSCFPQNFSGCYCAADKVLFPNDPEGVPYFDKPTSLLERFTEVFKRQKAGIKGKVLVFGRPNDKSLVDWMQKMGKEVFWVCLDEKNEIAGRHNDMFVVNDLEIVHGAALDFILEPVFTCSAK